MTISLELQRVYSSNPVGVTTYDALLLTHPDWDTDMAYITNTIEYRTFNLLGQSVTFTPATFVIRLPTRNDLGIVDFEVTFPLTYDAMTLINLAEPSGVPITATLTTYLDSSLDPQMEPIVLQLDNLAINDTNVTGRAQRIDLLNRMYPRHIVRPDSYPGLLR